MNAEPAAVDWMAVMNEQFRGRAVLSTEEAWTIAMTWEEDVRQKVALKISRPTSVIETYSWIEFREADRGWRYAGGGPETALAVRSQRYAEAVRATVLTWLALSSCPGFQVHENPILWKYVLRELREPKDKSLPRPSVSDVSSKSFNPVKDARRMADDVLTHVCISFNALYCRVVSGLAPSFDAEITAKLEPIVSRLAPLADEKLAQQPIHLKLKCTWLFETRADLETLITDINSHAKDKKLSVRSPEFVVDELCRCKFTEIPTTNEEFHLHPDDNTQFAEVAAQILSVLMSTISHTLSTRWYT